MSTTTIRQLLVVQLHPAADNPRAEVGDVDELAASIAAQGIVQPLVVAGGDEGPWTIVAGHRRHAAALQAGLDAVPCVVRDLTDAQRREIMLVENLQRRDLTPIEQAYGFRQLIDDHGYSQRQLAERVGVTQGHVSKRLKLLTLPGKVLAGVDDGSITIEDALHLAKLVDKGGPGAISRALKKASSYYPLARAVQDELDTWNTNRRVARRTAELQAAGVTIVDKAPGWYRAGAANSGPVRLTDLAVHRDVGDGHDGAPCHAAYVDPYALSRDHDDPIVAVCTDPDSHPPRDPDEDASAAAARAEREARAAALEGQQGARAELAARLVAALDAGDLDAAEFIGHVFEQALPGLCDYRSIPVARELLGLPATEAAAGSMYGEDYADLRAYAAEGPYEQVRTVWALTLAAGDYRDAWGLNQRGDTGRRSRAHLRFLQRHGYEPSTYELDEVAAAEGRGGDA